MLFSEGESRPRVGHSKLQHAIAAKQWLQTQKASNIVAHVLARVQLLVSWLSLVRNTVAHANEPLCLCCRLTGPISSDDDELPLSTTYYKHTTRTHYSNWPFAVESMR